MTVEFKYENSNMIEALDLCKLFIMLTSKANLYLIISTFTLHLNKNTRHFSKYFKKRKSTMKRNMKSASTFMIRLECVFMYHLITMLKTDCIWEIWILFFNKSIKIIMWCMLMMHQQMEQEIMSNLTWNKMKYLPKNTPLSTMKRTKEIVPIFTWLVIIIVKKVKLWYCLMEMILWLVDKCFPC